MGVYVLKNDTHLSRTIEKAGTLAVPENIEEISEYAKWIPEGSIVVDAGACIGDHAVVYSQLVGVGGYVYAFEPHPHAFAALKRNMARLNNVTVYNIALGCAAGVQRLQMEDNAGASYVSEDGLFDVNCVPLDGLVHRCDFIHLDVEGYESCVLKGAKYLIERCRPVMSIEVCDSHLRRAGSSEQELMAILEMYGYNVISTSPYRDLRNDLCVPR